MRRKLWSAGMLAAMVLCLAGCGVRENPGDQASEGDRAGEVIQNSVKTSEERQLEYLKADLGLGTILTKHCLYDDEGEDDTVVVQMDHQGNELSRVNLETGQEGGLSYGNLMCGSDKRIIFSRYDADADELAPNELYSVPIRQTDAGETVQWEQQEKLVSGLNENTDEYAMVFLCEPYLVYQQDDHTLVRLDLETKESKTLSFSMDEDSSYDCYQFALVDDFLFFREQALGKKAAAYRIRIDDWTSEKLYECEDPSESIFSLSVDGQFLYIEVGNIDEDGMYTMYRIECLDMEQKKTTGQLSIQAVNQYLEDEGMLDHVEGSEAVEKLQDIEISSIYAGKLYITSWWWMGGDGDAVREVLLSCSGQDMSELQLERDATEKMQEYACKDPGTMIVYGYGELYYFRYDDRDGEGESHLMRYHLDTKQIEEVDKKELIWLVYEKAGEFF